MTMEGVSDLLISKAISHLANYRPGGDFDDPVSMLQRNLRIGYTSALALTEALEKMSIWSPLINGTRFLARDLCLHISDTIDVSKIPRKIEFIDAIAREKQRDVLCVVFVDCEPETESPIPYQELPIRRQIIAWLNSQELTWEPCAAFADPYHPTAYSGRIYIDVDPSTENPQYGILQHYFEEPTGKSRFPGVHFCCLPFLEASENTIYDEPGYYDACLAYLFFSSKGRKPDLSANTLCNRVIGSIDKFAPDEKA